LESFRFPASGSVVHSDFFDFSLLPRPETVFQRSLSRGRFPKIVGGWESCSAVRRIYSRADARSITEEWCNDEKLGRGFPPRREDDEMGEAVLLRRMVIHLGRLPKKRRSVTKSNFHSGRTGNAEKQSRVFRRSSLVVRLWSFAKHTEEPRLTCRGSHFL
jgi:hypothetical protein